MNRQEKGGQLTLDQIKKCEEGPQREKAVGVSVAKIFGKDRFIGKVDSFRTVRQRIYYHVVYTDGDGEEMTQTELRNAYVLGLSDVINTVKMRQDVITTIVHVPVYLLVFTTSTTIILYQI